MPKLWKKRPTRPAMKATGRKMTTSDSVVAMTARLISLVAPAAARIGDSPFSSMWRKMFSSTTTASSMTMPMASTSPSMVMLLSVKPISASSVKVAMIEVGMATAAISVRAQVGDEEQHREAHQDGRQHEVELHLVDRALDEARLVADDLAA